MKIIVCIKQVPDTTEIKINPTTGTLIREGVPSIINPDDKAGLELALSLKDSFNAHVTVITMGPPQAEDVLREAYAMGVDRAILLTDRKFAGADTLATSYALASAIRKMEFDLLITGRQAIDGDTAQVGPQIAEHLDLPQVSYLEHLEFDGKNTFTVKRRIEDGYEMLQVDGPCVVTVLSGAYKPRYMTVRGIVEAFSRDVEVWGFEQIDVEETKLGLKGSPTRVHKAFSRGVKSPGQLYEVDADEAAGIIMSKLKEKFII
ncbi:MAG TPA: electron transfer flavoprotein subunit beta [Bacteroidales bacterium]|mgnify:FL=1|nr:electron transfer flavoprotein subunit beta/FixA family protein [Bacteroidales bacterium]MDD3891413.1 electron transfer flavoprotein subunit beta/FixA family protein [Bacteroidales bacterium]HCY00777.1 electron transfer flavoprotein subunit beta [Bacteroidales bacterium]